MIKRFLRGDKAQGMADYILMVFLIVILAYVSFQLFGEKIKNAFNKIIPKVDRAAK